MTNYNKHTNCRHIDFYINEVLNGNIRTSKRFKKCIRYIKKQVTQDGVTIDHERTERAIEIIERYFEYELMPWQKFIVGLVHCFKDEGKTVLFKHFLIIVGRGNGKNGFISGLAWYLSTHDHGVDRYNIDIIANSEDQAKTSFEDIYEVLENHWGKLKRHFYKSKQLIQNLKTKSKIQYNTSNARTKDGKRSACLIFDEVHEYEDYDSIKVFTSGFGKRPFSRIFTISTNGYVRDGVFDDYMNLAEQVIDGEIEDIGLCPLIYSLNEVEEIHDKENWIMANPSLPYFPELKNEMDTNYIEMKTMSHIAEDFISKRMNLNAHDAYTEAIPWDQVLMASDEEIPFDELIGAECLGAIDYAQINDFCSVGLLFKHNGKRYFHEHSFVCEQVLLNPTRRIRFPVREEAERGGITIIKHGTITPEIVAEWFVEHARKYNIKNIYGDRYRMDLLKSVFNDYGLPLSTVPSGEITHGKVSPLLESLFAEGNIKIGNNRTMRWYIRNTAKKITKKGNTTYEKIEPKLRKTDGFFALIHVLVNDSEIKENKKRYRKSFRTYTY